jgi:hypothetical protein
MELKPSLLKLYHSSEHVGNGFDKLINHYHSDKNNITFNSSNTLQRLIQGKVHCEISIPATHLKMNSSKRNKDYLSCKFEEMFYFNCQINHNSRK